jgi:hypothetical protein
MSHQRLIKTIGSYASRKGLQCDLSKDGIALKIFAGTSQLGVYLFGDATQVIDSLNDLTHFQSKNEIIEYSKGWINDFLDPDILT